ncbi:hypothetical protein SNE40_004043 [Patella caerulea]|uniref:Uncharacterized protein n=1 Tax=Patella caerulea TaxID=87958 RepID=A0AAN8KFD3_PATCE
METLKTGQGEDFKQLLKDKKKREHELETYKKQTEEKEALTKEGTDEKDTFQQLLFDACRHGTLSDTDKMVNNDINARDIKDRTSLFTCCQSIICPVEPIQYLVSQRADTNARDNYHNTLSLNNPFDNRYRFT